MRALDCLVLPSRSRANWTEQFGRVLTEAMASGIPVIGTDSGEISQVIGDAGIVVPEDNAPILAVNLTALPDDPDWWADLAIRGRTQHWRNSRKKASPNASPMCMAKSSARKKGASPPELVDELSGP